MESFFAKFKDVPSDSEMVEAQEFLSTEIGSQPRFSCTLKSLGDVEEHFNTSEMYIDKPTLALYQSMLGAHSKTQVLAFLLAVHNGTSGEKFHEIPTQLISKMQGRACKTRDLEDLSLQKEKPLRQFNSHSLSLLLCTREKIQLLVKGEEVESVNVSNTALITPVPTSSSLEQFAVSCTNNGHCKILSTTRKNLKVVGEFQIDTPKGELIHWMDILSVGNKTIMYWGGNDALRGKILWSYHTGIDFEALENSDKDLFYELDSASELYYENIEKRFKQMKADAQDYSIHGNVLTLWSQCIEAEYSGKRKWNEVQSIVMGTRVLSKLQDEKLVFAWGSPQQYLTINEASSLNVYLGGEKVNKSSHHSTKVLKHDTNNILQCGCVLYAHCR